MWLTIEEVRAIFSKSRSSVDFAIWRDNVKSRKAVAGCGIFVEFESCVKYWGAPVAPHLVDLVRSDIHG